MKLLQTYLGRTIIFSTLLVILAVLALETFVNFVSETKYIGQGDYGVTQAFVYVLWGLPQEIYNLFPMMAMLGVIVGLGNLAAHHELMVYRTSGLSVQQITGMVIKTVVLMIVIITLIGVFLAPAMVHWAQRQKSSAMSGGQAITTLEGTWLKNGNTFIHVAAILPGGHLKGVTRYTFSANHQLEKVSFAEEANYDNHHWRLQQIVESRFYPDHIEKVAIASENINMALNPVFIHAAEEEPRELTLPKLFKFIRYQELNGLHANEYWLVFWQRLMQPIASLVMIFLAIPCMFGPLRSATIGLRMIFGVAIGFSFYIVNSFFGPMTVVYQIPPLLAATLPSLLFLLAGIWMMRRVR